MILSDIETIVNSPFSSTILLVIAVAYLVKRNERLFDQWTEMMEKKVELIEQQIEINSKTISSLDRISDRIEDIPCVYENRRSKNVVFK